jgi:hypothetical protein
VSVLFALLAAFSNALNVATQHIASTSSPAALSIGWPSASPLWP